MTDTEARKHIRELLSLVMWYGAAARNPQYAKEPEYIAAQAYLDAEPAVLTVDGGGIDEVSQDEAVRLLPCHSPDVHVLVKGMTWNQHGIGCPAIYRPAVAKLLTTLRSQLAKQSEEMAGMRRAALEESIACVMHWFFANNKNAQGCVSDIRALIDPKTGQG